MSTFIGAKLKHLIAAAKLTPAQFTSEFTSAASSVRKAVAEAWLEDKRAVYDANLKKLANYWEPTFPGITASHFLMPDDDFVRTLEPPRAAQGEVGVVLPMQMNPLSGAQLSALTGSYRLYRYSISSTPTVVCEAVSIFRDANNAPTLRAELRSPLAKGVQKFVGTVVAIGDRIYLLLSDIDAMSSAMRFISMHGRFERKGKHVVGIMSGIFDRDETIASVTVAMLKESPDHALGREAVAWLSLDALSEVDAELIFDLSTKKAIKTT